MKRLVTIILVFLLCINLAGCAPEAGPKNYSQNTSLIKIENKNDLYFDPDTKVVYFIFSESLNYGGYGYMSPYYAANGLPYLYDANSQSVQ